MKKSVANRTVTLSAPVIKVDEAYLPSDEEMKENYTPGIYVFDGQTAYNFGYFDGNYLYTICLPKSLFEAQIVVKAVQDERDNLSMLLSGYVEGYTDRMSEIAVSLAVIKDAIENMVEAKQEGRTGNIDILDIAKACAVMQQPQLITELSKK